MRIAEFAELDAIALAGALREGTVSQSEVIEAARSARLETAPNARNSGIKSSGRRRDSTSKERSVC